MDKSKFKGIIENLFFPKGLKCIICDDELAEDMPLDICKPCLDALPYNNGRICLKCGTKLENKSNYCTTCRHEKIPFKKARAPFIYDGAIKQLIHHIKYDNARYLFKPLAKFLIDQLLVDNFHFDVIVPVPLHSKRLKQRGYNQSELLANEVSLVFNKPVLTDVLIRNKQTIDQTTLEFNERAKNLCGAFSVINAEKIYGKKVLLVDDVYTTGATIKNCAEKLMESQCNDIYAITIAHTLRK